MVNIIRTRRNSISSFPRAEVGEIDTRAPFQSVRAAVSLFGSGDTSSPREKPLSVKKTKPSGEGVLDKEAQFHLTQKKLSKFKEQVKNAEATMAVALPELQKAKKTVDNLRDKLKTLNESKLTISEATEALNIKAKKLEEEKSNKSETDIAAQDVDASKEEYRTAVVKLDAAKQELSKLRRDFDAAMVEKQDAMKRSEEAQFSAQVNKERVGEISKQIAEMQESIGQVKFATEEASLELAKISVEKNVQLESHTLAKEEYEKKLVPLREEYGTQHSQELELKLAETKVEIEVLEKEVENTRWASLEYQNFSTELRVAKQELEHMEGEKKSLQTIVGALMDELGNIGKDISEVKEHALQAEALAEKLQAELQTCKTGLEEALAKQTNKADPSDAIVSTLEQLAMETEKAKKEAEEINKASEGLRKEARNAQEMSAQMEETLSHLLKEAEEAKSSERLAVDENKAMSERTDASLASTSDSDNKIKLSEDQYKSLKERVDDSGRLGDMKVAAAMAQVEALIASQMEAAKKLEASLKEIEDLTVATEESLKQAEVADAAKRIIESELERWRQQENGLLT
ncbi:hypothetical protein Droror1_Dr00015856 [Drosera rotundifolia]